MTKTSKNSKLLVIIKVIDVVASVIFLVSLGAIVVYGFFNLFESNLNIIGFALVGSFAVSMLSLVILRSKSAFYNVIEMLYY